MSSQTPNRTLSARETVLPLGIMVIALMLPLQVSAQQEPPRWFIEAGLVGGYDAACPGRYAGVNGRATSRLSVFAVIENYRCEVVVGSANRAGLSILVGRPNWFVRPSLRTGLEIDGGELTQTAGASLTIGRRIGARINVIIGNVTSDNPLGIIQLGGFLGF